MNEDNVRPPQEVKLSDMEFALVQENTRLRAANKHLQAAVRGSYGMAADMLDGHHVLGQINGTDVIHRAVVAKAVAEWRALIKTLKTPPVDLKLDNAPVNVVELNTLAEVGVPVENLKGDRG